MWLIFFIFGLNIGSFLNVVIFRLRSGEKGIVNGRSHCQSCKRDLMWYDNLPVVSYVILRGKCRFCHKNISIQYPLVEGVTGSTFVLVYFAFVEQFAQGLLWGIAASIAIAFAAMLVVFVYDMKYMEVPMVAIWIAVVAAIVSVILRSLVEEGLDVSFIISHMIAGAAAFLFFFSISYYSREEWMGYGDGYIALVIGIMLGPLPTFVALLCATWIGAVVGIGLAAMQKASMKTAIPFGPFLIAGLYIGFVMSQYYPEWLHILW